jgi:hypothetical protein
MVLVFAREKTRRAKRDDRRNIDAAPAFLSDINELSHVRLIPESFLPKDAIGESFGKVLRLQFDISQ